MRILLAVAVAGFVFTAISGTARAAPIAPLPPGYTVDLGILSSKYFDLSVRIRIGLRETH